MRERKPSPSEIRMAELCALRRELSDAEIGEVLALRVTIRRNENWRRRYAEDREFRQRWKARQLKYWRENRA